MITQHPHGYTVKIAGKKFKPEHIIRVDLEDGLDMLDELTVEIRNPDMTYTKGANKWRGQKIELEAGRYGLQWDTLFVGRIGRPLKSGDRQNGHRITIKALPVDITDGWHQKRFLYYQDYQRFSDVVADIARQFHPEYRTQIESSPNVGQIIPIQQGETDIQFCKRMALECGGWEFVIKGMTVIFRKPRPVEAPVFEFEYGRNFTRYEEIETDEESQKSASVVIESGVNKIKTEKVTMDVDDTRKTAAGKADTTERAYTGTGKPTNSIFRPASDGLAAQSEAVGHTVKPAVSERILEITAPIDIRCRAGRAGTVKGLGSLDGKYYARLVNYKWSRSDSGTMIVRLSNRQGN